MKCVGCGQPIPEARLEACPGTETCVNCSDVKPYRGFMVFPHKTGGFLATVNPSNSEALRQAERADKRSR